MTWLLDNIIGIVGILVGGFIAYHVYFLSRKLELRDRLSHRDQVRNKTENLLDRISRGINREVELINSKKYSSHYPNDNEYDKNGHTYLRAELKALRYDGIEFFSEMPRSVYQKANGSYSLKEEREGQESIFTVFPVGLIPYEWIEYVDIKGDEFSYRPQFFTLFRGKQKFPYKLTKYYKESDVYHAGSDPIDMKWSEVEIN